MAKEKISKFNKHAQPVNENGSTYAKKKQDT